MNGDEWKQGMENEAESVTDAQWARETRFTAAQAKPNHLWFDLLFCAGAMLVIPLAFWGYWTALVNCRLNIHETALGCWASQHVGAIDGVALFLLLTVPLLLGLLRVRFNAVLLAFALMPIVKSLWPAIMPLLNLQPRLESVGLSPLNMLDYVRFSWLTLAQMIVCPLLAWLTWLLGRKLNQKMTRA